MSLAPAQESRNEPFRIPALVVRDGGRRLLAGSWTERLAFCDRLADLRRLLEAQPVDAVVIETRDADGAPVPAELRAWAAQHPRLPIIVWTAGSRSALREVLALSVAGGDVRLVLHPRDDLPAELDRLLTTPTGIFPGAVPALLRGVVLPAPQQIHPELTLAVYGAWPRPSVEPWATALNLTRQALNRRLASSHYCPASVVLDHFSAAEIAIRLTLRRSLRELAAEMGRTDGRSLRRRLTLLRTKPEQLRDDADFRAVLPRIDAGIRRLN